MVQPKEQPNNGSVKVLLIEDDPNDAFLLQRALAKASPVRFEVERVGRLETALQCLQGGRFDAALLDLSLPDSEGLETLDAVRNENPDVPIVVLSGIDNEDTAIGALQHGAQDYLVKGEASGDLVIRCIRYAIERKRAEEALRKSELKFRSVTQSAIDAIISADKDGNIIFWNEGAQRIFGYTEKEVLGKPLTMLMPQRYRQAHQEGMERVSSTGETRVIGHTLELHGLRKDGDEFPLDLSLSTWETSEGPFYSGIIRDATERKKAEQALRSSEERYRTLLESIPQRIFFKDRNSVFVSMNAPFAQDAGMSVKELVGKTDYDIHPTELAEKYRADDRRVMATRQAEILEEINVVGDRDRSVEVVKAPVISDDGEVMGVLGMFTDITERKRIEKEIKTLNKSLESRVAERTKQLQTTNQALEEEITERKQVEVALRESEVRFRSVFENAHDAIVIMGDEGLCLDANSAACELSGFPREQLLGIPYMRFFAPDRLEEAQELWRLFLQQGELQGEIQVVRPDGETRDVEFSCKANFLPGYHLAIVYDVTGRKRAENELRKSRDQLDVILKNVANGITLLDPGGNFIFANDAAAKIMGFPSAQALVQTPGAEIMSKFDILDESRQALPVDMLPGRRALKGEESPEMLICWRVKATGDERWSIVKGTAVFGDKGQIQFVINLFLDVTERKLIEETVHVRAQQQALVADFGQRALAGTDLSTLMDEACVLLARALNADLAKVLELLPDRDVLLLRSGVGWNEGFVGHALVSTGPESQAGYILRSKGPVIVEDLRTETRFRGTPVLHKHNAISGVSVMIPGKDNPFGVLSVHTKSKRIFTEYDIHFLQAIANVLAMATERKRVEEEIITLNFDLQNANKELEAFSYSVSHDLHAPLRAIAGFSDALIEEYASVVDAQGRHYLDRIRSNAERGGELIDDLLALSRLGRKPMQKANIDMKELALSVFEELQLDTPDHVPQLNMEALPPASGDRSLMREVFINLLSNAIKFTKGKELALIEVGGREEGNEVIYYVKDNGAGFDMRFVGKLFGVFQRLHTTEEFEGTGVGLAIVQRIVYRHGGRVWAEGKVGEGATFYFALPK